MYRIFTGLLLALFGAEATLAEEKGGLTAPTGVTATLGNFNNSVTISWDPVVGATGYSVAIYGDLFTNTRISTAALLDVTTYSPGLPCGVYQYYEVFARDGVVEGPVSARVLGYTTPCDGGAVQSCDFEAIPLSGSLTLTGNTATSQSSYRIGDRSAPCADGNDPGTGGVGPDQVFTYISPVDCTLSITLTELDPFLAVLYVANTCETFACDYYNFNPGGAESLTVEVTANQPTYIFVDGYNGGSGAYSLQLQSGDCEVVESCADPVNGFDFGNVPGTWSLINLDGNAPTQVGRYALPTWSPLEDLVGSPFNYVMAAYSNPSVVEQPNDWLIAGPFTLGESSALTWRDARVGNTGTVSGKVYVAAMQNVDAFLAEGSIFAFSNDNVASTYTTREIPLAPEGFANQTVYVGFRHASQQAGYLLLDDIGICTVDIAPEGEGTPEGEDEGEGPATQTADQDGNFVISLSELLRVIQFYNTGGLQCGTGTEDGYAPGAGNTACTPHSTDYAPQNWIISLSELLRLIQFYNTGGYAPCETGEDGFCPQA